MFNFFKQDPAEQKNKKFSELEKSFSDDKEMISNTKAGWLTSRANHYGEKGKYDESIKDFEEAIKLKPDYLPAFFGMAIAYKEKGNIAKAEEIIKNAPNQMKLHGEVVTTKQNAMEQMMN